MRVRLLVLASPARVASCRGVSAANSVARQDLTVSVVVVSSSLVQSCAAAMLYECCTCESPFRGT
jgi:hypothetical protein